MGFCYVYILRSEKSGDRFYVGHTGDLRERLKRHNAGEVPTTACYRPWHIKTAIAFTDPVQAVHFERYLKTSSGTAFARKRL
jgi:putative endonuclease